jgi:hypothetical protein
VGDSGRASQQCSAQVYGKARRGSSGLEKSWIFAGGVFGIETLHAMPGASAESAGGRHSVLVERRTSWGAEMLQRTEGEDGWRRFRKSFEGTTGRFQTIRFPSILPGRVGKVSRG